MPDPETLRSVAKLARQRASTAASGRPDDRRDGLERLGAERALVELAKDLEATADHCGPDGEGDA